MHRRQHQFLQQLIRERERESHLSSSAVDAGAAFTFVVRCRLTGNDNKAQDANNKERGRGGYVYQNDGN